MDKFAHSKDTKELSAQFLRGANIMKRQILQELSDGRDCFKQNICGDMLKKAGPASEFPNLRPAFKIRAL